MTNQDKALSALRTFRESEVFTTDIAKKAGLTTKQAYTALAALLKKGLVRRVGNTEAYWAPAK